MRVLRGSNAAAVIARLNPIIKGWAAYYRGVVSSKVFHTLDYQMWKLTYKWATWQHNNKPKRWIVEHYFGKRNKFRNDRWVFGDPGSDAYLVKFSWTDIVRHVMVQGAASPDDPALADYWAERRRKVKPPLDNYTLRLLARQDARCPLCGDHLLTADQPPQSPNDWERWWQQVTRQAIAADYLVHHGRSGPPHNDQTRLVHASCRRGLRARRRRTQHSNLHALAACLSRMPRRVARTVLRGDRRGNPPVLPGGRAGAADRDRDQLTRAIWAACAAWPISTSCRPGPVRSTRRLLDTERVGQGCVLASPAFERIARPTLTEEGRRAPALRFGDPRVQALAGALCTSAARRHRHHQQEPARLDDRPARRHRLHHQPGQLRPGPAARQRAHHRVPATNRYRLTGDGLRFAIFYTKVHDRLLRPLLAANQPPAPPHTPKGVAHHRHSRNDTTSTPPDCHSKQPENSRQLSTS